MKFDREKWAQEELRRAIEIEKNSRGEKSEDVSEDLANDTIQALTAAVFCYEYILHSEVPKGLVSQVLNQLIQEQPLTPIHEDDDIWELDENQPETGTKYFCTRLPSLTKLVTTDEDGEEKVKYNDSGRYYCFDVFQPGRLYTGGLAEAVLNELAPIEFPYHPSGKFAICTERFRAYPTTPGVDTVGVLHMRVPDGHTVSINKYFKLMPDGSKWVETNGADYQSRRRKARDISYKEYKEKVAQEETDGEC